MEQARISGRQGHHGTQESRGARGAGKAAGNQDTAAAQGADTTGFSFLLASLGDGGLPTDTADAATWQADAQDPAALAALQSGLPYAVSVQPGGAGVADGGRWPGTAGAGAQSALNTQAAAGGLAGLAGAGGMAGQNGLSGMAFGAEKAGVESLVGQTALLDGAAEAAGVNGTGLGGSAAPWRGGVAGRFQSTLAAAGADASAGATLGSALRSSAKDDKKASTADLGGATSLAAAAATATPSLERKEFLAAAGASPAGGRGGLDDSLAIAASPLSGVGDLAAAGGDARASARGGESSGQGAGASQAPAGVGESGHKVQGGDAAFSLDAAAVDPAQAAMEDQLAEQVAFWVNQKTQNAELTLDRDGQPVEVVVSLTGNEAHVTFRSDQAHTREMLDHSVAQLRDLLQAEGLQLSGMTVGTSGGQDGGRGGESAQGDGRPGARQATVQAAAPAGAATRAQQVTDRSVDIFV